MKVIVLDDTRQRQRGLVDALHKKRVEVTGYYGSNDFINAVEKNKFDFLLLDMESWNRGKSIYSRFRIAKRIEIMPIVFYNAPENFSVLPDRPRHPKDRILFKPTEAEAVVASLLDNR
jgi:DNA-binding response OmpR family regulator